LIASIGDERNAALPLDVRKGYAFPIQILSLIS
jgi:hypothetical protein